MPDQVRRFESERFTGSRRRLKVGKLKGWNGGIGERSTFKPSNSPDSDYEHDYECDDDYEHEHEHE